MSADSRPSSLENMSAGSAIRVQTQPAGPIDPTSCLIGAIDPLYVVAAVWAHPAPVVKRTGQQVLFFLV